jgi:hypothetical protein
VADIFHEVEEELRKDKYQDMLRTFGPWVAGAAAFLIIGVAGYEGWKAWTTQQEESASLTYTAALADIEASRPDEAASEFEDIAANGPDGYAVLALMQRGALALSEGEPELASAFFEQAAERSSDPIVSDLATLKSVWAVFEEYSVDDLSNRLGPLIEPGRPYEYLAREAIGIAALEAGDYARARRHLEAISYSLDASEGVRARANAALSVVARLAPPEDDVVADDGDVPAAESVDAPADDPQFNLTGQDPEEDAGDEAFGDSDLPELNISTDDADDGALEDQN